MALVISWPFQCWPVMVLSVLDLVTTGFCFVFEENHLVVSGARFIFSLELLAKIINIYIYTHVHTDQIQLSRIVKGNWSKRYWKLWPWTYYKMLSNLSETEFRPSWLLCLVPFSYFQNGLDRSTHRNLLIFPFPNNFNGFVLEETENFLVL